MKRIFRWDNVTEWLQAGPVLKALQGPQIGAVEVRNRRFWQVLELANRVARFDTSILITGETGVGKEVLARHSHANSSRTEQPVVAVDCATIPNTLLECALFAHKAGAFTGATKDQPGLFEEAH